MRLDVAVANGVEGLSRSGAARLIRDGLVMVDGRACRRASLRVRPGAQLAVDLPGGSTDGEAAAAVQFQVSFEDEHLVIVDKPAGVVVHPGAGHSGDTLVEALLVDRDDVAAVGEPGRPGVVHRLDKDTSGLLVFAKTGAAYSKLVDAIGSREVVRTYTALVEGSVSPSQGVVDAPVGRDPARRTRQAVVSSGKAARTRYRIVERFQAASLLEVVLETGRMHQVRVHMAAIEHPVIGDRTYGGKLRLPGLSRQFLHASRLQFQHPVTGKPMDASSPLPEDLRRALAQLRPA